MNILIATDSFKGCLSSTEAGQAIEKGIIQALPKAETKVLAVSDGGEGMLQALMQQGNCSIRSFHVHDALLREMDSSYLLSNNHKEAYIETAKIIGLPLLKPSERNPMQTSSYGVGEAIIDAIHQGAEDIYVCLGGSSTNDAGIGLAQALGYHFLDKTGNELLPIGQSLPEIRYIVEYLGKPLWQAIRFHAVCDVTAPFFGPQGAAYVFAPQKGATPEQVKTLDDGMKLYAGLLTKYTGIDVTQQTGAGAAGGIGGCLACMFHAKQINGIEMLLQTSLFQNAIKEADLIITGEGRFDQQTSMGKVAFGILEEGRKHGNKTVYLICGSMENPTLCQQMGFKGGLAVTPTDMDLEEAMKPETAKKLIQEATFKWFYRFLAM